MYLERRKWRRFKKLKVEGEGGKRRLKERLEVEGGGGCRGELELEWRGEEIEVRKS